jgi:hypothetical protein
MHNDSTARGVTRALVAVLTAAALAACADEAPVAPKATVPDGGVKSVALGINILPAGQAFSKKVAFVTGSPNGKAAYVQVYAKDGAQLARFKAFTDTWDNGGVEVATGDVTGDGWPDIIAGEGPTPFSPTGSRFGVWDGRTGVWIGGFSMGTSYTAGYRVAAGDVNGDGRDEIFTCTGPSSEASRYNVLEYHPNVPNIGYLIATETLGWFTGKNTYNGCRVAGGDLNGDGKKELIVVFEGPANALLVRAFNNGTSTSLPGGSIRWNAFGAGYTGSISIAAADVNGDKKAEVFLGRLTALDKVPPVRIYDGAAIMTNSTLPSPTVKYPIQNSIYNTGIHVAAHDLSGDGVPELLAKLSTTGFYSSYVAWMGPFFSALWLNQFEPPGTLPGGGPIG